MARDRKRAKQRRDRRDRRPPAGRGGLRTGVRRAEEEEELEAPSPLEHSSAEVDIAEAQMAVGRPELADDEEPLTEAELIEAEEADAELADAEGGGFGGGRRGRGADDEEEGGPVPSAGGPARARPREVPGNRILAFLQGSWRELQRVQWPDRKQVAQATGVVIVFVIVAGLFLGLIDAVSQKIVNAIL
jgi:preprotein translocase subunit SecE